MAALWDCIWRCGDFDPSKPETYSYNIFETDFEHKLGKFKWAFCKPDPMYETLPDEVNKDRFRMKGVVMYHGWLFIATSSAPMNYQVGKVEDKKAIDKVCKMQQSWHPN